MLTMKDFEVNQVQNEVKLEKADRYRFTHQGDDKHGKTSGFFYTLFAKFFSAPAHEQQSSYESQQNTAARFS